MLDIVGPSEIATMLRVHPVTVSRWQRDGVLPPAEAELRRGPVWQRSSIVEWAVLTGREVENHAAE
jgi:hypothetical protein